MAGIELKETEQLLKALANRRRITMLRLLKREPLSVGELAEKLKLSFKATSNHLALLRAADIVERDQVGLVMNYRLTSPLHPMVKIVLTES